MYSKYNISYVSYIDYSFSFPSSLFCVGVCPTEMINYIAYNCVRMVYHPIVSLTYGKFPRDIL